MFGSATNEMTFDIELNQVRVGTLSAVDIREIRRKAFTDYRNYLAQAKNLLHVLIRVTDYFFLSTPLVLFWLAVGTAFFVPDTIRDALKRITEAGPATIHQGIAMIAAVMAVLTVGAVGINVLVGSSRFGYVNHFGLACETAIRKRLGVPARGSLRIIRVELSEWKPGVGHDEKTAH